MSAMFLAMVWHARRRQDALGIVERQAAQRASLLQRQERFLHDASHELRTPVTIARGHLEVHSERTETRLTKSTWPLTSYSGSNRSSTGYSCSRRPTNPTSSSSKRSISSRFWKMSSCAGPRWHRGRGTSAHSLRGRSPSIPKAFVLALDALLENAVKYTEGGDTIELRSRASAGNVVIEIADGGEGVPREALAQIFERFARADPARTRAKGGVGLGLAIVDAIAKAHGGRCTVKNSQSGATFALRLPRFEHASVSTLQLLQNS